ncbi:zinc finger protein 91 [Nematostella vectensis]|uniref:zinc finger protein 91 n=1 Tax=Nematostella vectensis TaxID=45351 RepID=UPI00138FD1E4|nr:zinc finger protein 91 [Nematostella vectensis]XP_048586553.1 zinc finger protein 91 [Nematostella vectensis]
MTNPWFAYQCRSGEILFYYNKETGEHRLADQYTKADQGIRDNDHLSSTNIIKEDVFAKACKAVCGKSDPVEESQGTAPCKELYAVCTQASGQAADLIASSKGTRTVGTETSDLLAGQVLEWLKDCHNAQEDLKKKQLGNSSESLKVFNNVSTQTDWPLNENSKEEHVRSLWTDGLKVTDNFKGLNCNSTQTSGLFNGICKRAHSDCSLLKNGHNRWSLETKSLDAMLETGGKSPYPNVVPPSTQIFDSASSILKTDYSLTQCVKESSRKRKYSELDSDADMPCPSGTLLDQFPAPFSDSKIERSLKYAREREVTIATVTKETNCEMEPILSQELPSQAHTVVAQESPACMLSNSKQDLHCNDSQHPQEVLSQVQSVQDASACASYSEQNLHTFTYKYRVPDKVKLYGCSHCTKSFTSASILERHLFFHSGARKAMLEAEEAETLKQVAEGATLSQAMPDGSSVAAEQKQDVMGKTRASSAVDETNGDVKAPSKPSMKQKPIITSLPLVHRCEKCHKRFALLEELREHQLTHKDRRLVCKHCKKVFFAMSSLKKHVITAHDSQAPFWCPVCDRDYSRKDNLAVHMMNAHSTTNSKKVGPKGNRCKDCDKRFGTKRSLFGHLSVCKRKKGYINEERDLDAIEANASDSASVNQVEQGKNDHRHACIHCGRSYFWRKNLVMHLKQCQDYQVLFERSERLYSCDKCSKKLKSLNELMLHQCSHIAEAHPDRPLHQCYRCQRVFHNKFFLRKHMDLGKCDAVKKHKCQLCSRSFLTQPDLSRHMRCHEKMTPSKQETREEQKTTAVPTTMDSSAYQCNNCSKAFDNSASLSRHLGWHGRKTPNKHETQEVKATSSPSTTEPFAHQCTCCSKKFNNSSRFLKHMTWHTKTRRLDSPPEEERASPSTTESAVYQCTQCSKSFSNSSSLATHIGWHLRMTSHKQELKGKKATVGSYPHKCIHCYKAFSNSSRLAKHLAWHAKAHKLDVPQEVETASPLESTFYQCSHCSKIYDNSSSLARHKARHEMTGKSVNPQEEDDVTASLTTMESLAHQCTFCSRSFHDYSSLAKHTTWHRKRLKLNSPQDVKAIPSQTAIANDAHRVSQNKTPAASSSSSASGDHQCTQCSKSFNSGSSLARHFAWHKKASDVQCHENSTAALDSQVEEKPNAKPSKMEFSDHKCTHCSLAFKDSSSLAKHNAWHAKTFKQKDKRGAPLDQNRTTVFSKAEMRYLEKHYRCMKCFSVYSSRNNFLRHVSKAHLYDTYYQCHMCGSSFTSMEDLTQHTLRKTRYCMPYTCTDCGESFAKCLLLLNHRISAHPAITEPSVAPTITEQSVNPAITEQSVNPAITEPSVAPTITEPSVNPAITEQSVNPAITEPSVAPTITEPSGTPIITEPSAPANKSNAQKSKGKRFQTLWRCSICNAAFVRLGNRLRHEKLHTCNTCGMVFRTIEEAYRHNQSCSQ